MAETTKTCFRLAGVTFDNDMETDGGCESRQYLLSRVYKKNKSCTVVLDHTTFTDPETNETEPAIRVRLSGSLKTVGWVPKSDIKECEQYNRMLLKVSEGNNGTYYGFLFVLKRDRR